MKKHLYEIKRLDIPAYLKWWFIKYRNAGTLSEVLENLTSPITLTNSLKRKFKIFEIGGKSEQETFTGKNKLNVPSQYTITQADDLKRKLHIEPNVTYKITFDNLEKGGNNNPSIIINGTVVIPVTNNRTFSITEEMTSANIYSNGSSYAGSEGITSTITNFMISTEGGTYEPYTGGQPAPNPSYECPIQNVTGNVEVKVANGTDSTATGYEEQTVTFPLSEGQVLHETDTIEDKIVQRRKTLKLNINQFTTTSFEDGTLILTNIRNSIGYYKNISGLCSHFQNANNYNIVDNGTARSLLQDNQYNFRAGSTTSERDRIYFKNSAFTRVEAWKNFFDNNEVTLEYELETPIETPFTEAQRTAKAQIDSLHSYKDTTYISSTNDPSPLFTIQYVKEET